MIVPSTLSRDARVPSSLWINHSFPGKSHFISLWTQNKLNRKTFPVIEFSQLSRLNLYFAAEFEDNSLQLSCKVIALYRFTRIKIDWSHFRACLNLFIYLGVTPTTPSRVSSISREIVCRNTQFRSKLFRVKCFSFRAILTYIP